MTGLKECVDARLSAVIRRGISAKDGRFICLTNWQVQQARESLEVYYERFRGIALAPRPDTVATPAAVPPAAPVHGPSRPNPTEQRSVTVVHPAQPKPLHGNGMYVPAGPRVKPFRDSLSGLSGKPPPPQPAPETTAADSASRTALVPGQW